LSVSASVVAEPASVIVDNAIEAGAGRIHVVFDTRASVCYTTRRNIRHEGLSLRL
jgi:hypothetical protein